MYLWRAGEAKVENWREKDIKEAKRRKQEENKGREK